MSKRNSQEAKRAARERLRIEREKQAKKERIRRQLTVGGATLAILAIAAGIAYAVSQMGGESEAEKAWKAAADKKLVKPENTSGENGTTILIGKKDAPTLEVYEDPRCPVCASFEQASGEALKKDIEDGKYRASFTLGTFLDRGTGIEGTGSRNAVSALGAALNESTDAFLEYKKALFSAEHHPSERDDKFGDDDYLIEVAQDVKELKGNAAFEKALKDGTYDRWALEMSEKFDDSPVSGTPAFRMFGETLVVEDAPEGTPIITPEQLRAAVDKALAENGSDQGSQQDDKDNKDAKEEKEEETAQ